MPGDNHRRGRRKRDRHGREHVSYLLGAELERLTLTGSGRDRGTGNGLGNVIQGNSGNNVLDGGVGADAMSGGLGDDIYIVDDVGDIVTEAAGAGNDEIRAALAAYSLGANVEKLTGTSDGGQTLSGNGSPTSSRPGPATT